MYKANKSFGLFLKKNNKFFRGFSVSKQNKLKYDSEKPFKNPKNVFPQENTEEKPIIKLSDNIFIKNMYLASYVPFYGVAVAMYDENFLKTDKNIHEPLYSAINVPEIVAKMDSEEKKTIEIFLKSTKGGDMQLIDKTHFFIGLPVKILSCSYVLENTNIIPNLFDNIESFTGCLGATFLAVGAVFLAAMDLVAGYLHPAFYKNMNDMHKIYLKYVVGKIEK